MFRALDVIPEEPLHEPASDPLVAESSVCERREALASDLVKQAEGVSGFFLTSTTDLFLSVEYEADCS